MPSRVTIGDTPARMRVMGHDLALGQALRPGGADVVLAHRVDHVAAHDACVDRREQQREHGPRQDHVQEPVGRAHGEGHVARPRQPAELLPEDVEAHQAEPEHRRGDAEEGEAHGGPVGERPALQRREDPDRDADQPARGSRAPMASWSVTDRRLPISSFIGDLRVVREAESRPAVLVAGHQALDVEQVLHRHGLVEPEILADLRDELRRRVAAGERDGRVLRRQHEEDRGTRSA